MRPHRRACQSRARAAPCLSGDNGEDFLIIPLRVFAPGGVVKIPYAIFACAILAGLPAARADDTHNDIPTYKVLTCERDCPPYTPAKQHGTLDAVYPKEYRGTVAGYFGVSVEALVFVDFTVAADGSIKDAVVEWLLGPQAFADSALAAVNAQEFKPATEGGKPVEENHRVLISFTSEGVQHRARSQVIDGFAKAMQLVHDGKSDEGLAALKALEAQPLLNFYERCMIAYNEALLYVQAKDYPHAREAIRVATMFDGDYLDQNIWEDAVRERIKLEAVTGEFSESFAWREVLSNRWGHKPLAEVAELTDKLHAMIAAPDPLYMAARIPDSGTATMWQHALLRRSFEFHDIAGGALDRFELRCERHSIVSAVSDKADWNVPASWTGCYINVFGKPGTTFRFFELQPAAKP